VFRLRLANLLRTLAREPHQVSAVDIVLALAEALRTGPNPCRCCPLPPA
jgi:hypothetical protein